MSRVYEAERRLTRARLRREWLEDRAEPTALNWRHIDRLYVYERRLRRVIERQGMPRQ